MKLSLATALSRRKTRTKKRTHAEPRDDKPLVRQVQQLRRHYDRVAAVAARLDGRPAPRPGLAFKLTLAATRMQLNMSKRQAVIYLLRKMSAQRAGKEAE